MQEVALLVFELSLLIEDEWEGDQCIVALAAVLYGTEEVDDEEFYIRVVLDD